VKKTKIYKDIFYRLNCLNRMLFLWKISIHMWVLHLFYCFKIQPIREAFFLCTFTFDLCKKSIHMWVLHLLYCFKIHPIREAFFLCTFTFDLLPIDLLEWQQAVDAGKRYMIVLMTKLWRNTQLYDVMLVGVILFFHETLFILCGL